MSASHHNKNRSTLGVQRAILSVAVAISAFAGSVRSQEPSSTNPPASSQQTAPAGPTSSSKAAPHGHTPFDDFLIRGTVFNDKALALPGANIRIRRAGERRFRWQDVTNSRGDFALRVPHNASYEVVTHAKGFLDQSKTVDAKPGSTDQNLAFQMEPARGKK